MSTRLPALLMYNDAGVCPEVPMTMLPAPSSVIGAELTPEFGFWTTSWNFGVAGEGTTDAGAADCGVAAGETTPGAEAAGCGLTTGEATPGAAAAGAADCGATAGGATAGAAAAGAAACGVTAGWATPGAAPPGAATAGVATAVTGVVWVLTTVVVVGTGVTWV